GLPHRDHVGGVVPVDQALHLLPDQPVLVAIEVVLPDDVGDLVEGAVVEQQAADHRLFRLDRVRRHPQRQDLGIRLGRRRFGHLGQGFGHGSRLLEGGRSGPPSLRRAGPRVIRSGGRDDRDGTGNENTKGALRAPFVHWRRSGDQLWSPSTDTLISVSTSTCGATSTLYSPIALIGPSGMRIIARGTSKPSRSSASAIRAGVTDPNRRPSTPARSVICTVWPDSRSASARAAASLSACAFSSSARRASNSLIAFSVARLALP